MTEDTTWGLDDFVPMEVNTTDNLELLANLRLAKIDISDPTRLFFKVDILSNFVFFLQVSDFQVFIP